MVCIYCSSPTQVVNSRLQKRSNHIWRRRKCAGCAAVFTTEERAALQTSLVVENSNRQLAPFNRDRLLISIHDSCRHRTNSADDASALAQTIIARLMHLQRDGVINMTEIASATHDVLSRFDKTAAAVYAAYHINCSKAQ